MALHSTSTHSTVQLLGPREIYDSAYEVDKVLAIPYDQLVANVDRIASEAKQDINLTSDDLLLVSKILRRAPKLSDHRLQQSRLKLAKLLMRKSSELGNEPATLFLSEQILRATTSSKEERAEALHKLSSLAQTLTGSSGKANYLLANELYSIGRVQQATKAYRLAGEQGVPEAYTKLGRIYLESKLLEHAKEAFQLGANAGECNSQFMMSTLVHETAERVRYLTTAASNGSTEAAHNLGEHYRRQNDHTLAKEYLSIAATKGFQPSQMNLASLLLEARDYASARRWYQAAIKGGGELASHAQEKLKELSVCEQQLEANKCSIM